MTFVAVFFITLAVICVLGAILLTLAGIHGQKIIDQKNRKEEAKIKVDELRAQRLQRDLEVVENRAHLVASQEVRTALQIEKIRRELHMLPDPSNTSPTGTDSPAW